jgi:hypothetical protein
MCLRSSAFPRRDHSIAYRCIVAGVLPIAVAACLAGTAGPARPGARTLARIDALIGVASCDSEAQCRVALIGYRSCGGPESFRAWSIRFTEAGALEAALRDHVQERRHEQAKFGEMSTCQVLPVPAAACLSGAPGAGTGRCVLSPVAGGPGIR